jgi:hypothetical protein
LSGLNGGRFSIILFFTYISGVPTSVCLKFWRVLISLEFVLRILTFNPYECLVPFVALHCGVVGAMRCDNGGSTSGITRGGALALENVFGIKSVVPRLLK